MCIVTSKYHVLALTHLFIIVDLDELLALAPHHRDHRHFIVKLEVAVQDVRVGVLVVRFLRRRAQPTGTQPASTVVTALTLVSTGSNSSISYAGI